MTALPAPTRSAALARIAAVRPGAYARTRNHLDGAVTGLSPYITHGIVTLREVLAGVLQQGPLEVQHKFVFELAWREFFRHVWGHAGSGILQSLHPGPRPDAVYATTLPADVREARTGVPVVDEAVRTLYATGTLHNHARMWLASYVVHLRQVHWRAGADWLAAHLLDGDLGSNHLSWQWVAGTGSHKPYLFNADNVARFAPPAWHSPGTVVDQTYEALDHVARNGPAATATNALEGTPEPALHPEPPPGVDVTGPTITTADALNGRDVWLVHPWALRAPPAGLAPGTLVIGVYPREHHATWPWPAARWRWVDAAMADVTPQRWLADATALATALHSAASVRTLDDPHLPPAWRRIARRDPAPGLFPAVDRPFTSFSPWWMRATRGLRQAQELL